MIEEEKANPADQPRPASRLQRGQGVIREMVRTLPGQPGCYRMINARGAVLYVGKAKDLRKRVYSYTQAGRLPLRLQRMVAETKTMEFVSTQTEVEALLLEANLIKRFSPPYNVLLRDDKSFPYILITGDHEAPRITKHRGARERKGEYFGPFASAGAVNRTLVALQRAFLLRNCSDNVYETRTRPCLQYQIKRCSAPCVGRIGLDDYAILVGQARDFLAGKSTGMQQDLASRMQELSDKLEYERAAQLRDRIQALTQIQSHQEINLQDVAEADVIAAYQDGGQTCVQVFFFRNHGNYGNRAYFPAHDKTTPTRDVLAAFLGQFYENKVPPSLVLTNEEPAEVALLTEALSLCRGRRVEILAPRRGDKRKVVEHALRNAREALLRRHAESSHQQRLMTAIGEVFGLEKSPQRIEVYDNSHISGSNPFGAMIVAGTEGFRKNQYRKFAIRPAGAAADAPVSAGDDYAMMRQVLTRRFSRAIRENASREGDTWPDLVLIDGGQGQLNAALDVFAELGLDDVVVAAIAKGPDRNAGRERFFMAEREPFSLEPGNPVLFFLQRLRDEAHRFVIGAHRAKRSAELGRSALDEIPGIGPKRKKALLMHFGSAREVARAGLTDLEAAPGIDRAVARRIHGHFHGG
jgi:excinuclease ABC subunit C